MLYKSIGRRGESVWVWNPNFDYQVEEESMVRRAEESEPKGVFHHMKTSRSNAHEIFLARRNYPHSRLFSMSSLKHGGILSCSAAKDKLASV